MITKILSILFLFIYLINAQCNGPDTQSDLKPWSYGTSWITGRYPVNGEDVVLKNGTKLLLDVSTARLNTLTIQAGAALVFSSRNGPIELIANAIIVQGRLDIGDDNCRYNGTATITLTGQDGVGYSNPDFGQKFLGVMAGGKLEIHGQMTYPIPTWVKLAKTATSADNIINVDTDVSKWPVGSTIVVGSTDFDMYQSEQAKIVACPTCTAYQIKLNKTLDYYHFGAITYGIDQRAEVGLLTKNIVIRGEMQPSCNGSKLCAFFNFDTFGGHVMIMKDFGSAHIQGVELYNMGQTYHLARYPIHFHMCGDVDTGNYASWPSFVKDNSIHHTFSRCLTIHGTSGLVVVNNFAYDNIGHCYFFEDGSEQRNYLDSNVGLLTKSGYVLPSDRNCALCSFVTPTDFNGQPTSCSECNGVSTFWITNPNNYFRNNIAGGSERNGFWFLFPPNPSGLSEPLYPNVHPDRTPLGSFVSNKAHSNVNTGLNIDQSQQIVQPSASLPYQYMSLTYGRYKPRVDPTNWDSARAPAYFYDFSAYKNKWIGLWARGGDLIFDNCKFADNAISATLAQEGTMPADYGSSQSIKNSIFVAESENIGQASNGINTYAGRTIPAYQQMNQKGVEVYDGPTSVSNSVFYNYNTDGIRNISAIAWFNNDDWYFNPRNSFYGNSFVNSNLRVYNPWFSVPGDGYKNQVFRDIDGTVTGSQNSYVVPNNLYFTSSKSTFKSNWNMSVTTEKVASFFIYNKNLAASKIPSGVSGVIMIRDEYPKYRHALFGVPNNSPRDTFMPLVYAGKSYTMHFTHPTPPYLQIQQTNFDQGDSVVVGICYPTWGVTFNIIKQQVIPGQEWRTDNPTSTVKLGSSLWAVQNDATGTTAFYDSSTGLLFLRFIQNTASQWANYCPDAGCESFIIKITGSGVNTNTGDCSAAAYPLYAKLQNQNNGACDGELDECGVCNGDGRSCVKGDSSKTNQSNSKKSLISFVITFLFSLFSIFLLN
ncbi:hypothetical protein CYY_000025 [Polysphondylium violaceum]|uniref:G8 domain-containing protein n=1 Tax=Polysphondylium violaceum TaxID=133409 RepID=A0A8J4Q5F0_9MYCE|nr:hypothetical protein CYY_000025 [Polysphondylium violaceum]